MKKMMLLLLTLFTSTSLFASIPRELSDLLPNGESSIQLKGTTKDQKKCTVNLASSSTFSSSIAVLNENGSIDSRRFGKFQIGFGHELDSIESTSTSIVAVSTHNAEEQYSSDSRSTLSVSLRDDEIVSVLIKFEEKGLFGYKRKVLEECFVSTSINTK